MSYPHLQTQTYWPDQQANHDLLPRQVRGAKDSKHRLSSFCDLLTLNFDYFQVCDRPTLHLAIIQDERNRKVIRVNSLPSSNREALGAKTGEPILVLYSNSPQGKEYGQLQIHLRQFMCCKC